MRCTCERAVNEALERAAAMFDVDGIDHPAWVGIPLGERVLLASIAGKTASSIRALKDQPATLADKLKAASMAQDGDYEFSFEPRTIVTGPNMRFVSWEDHERIVGDLRRQIENLTAMLCRAWRPETQRVRYTEHEDPTLFQE